MKSLALRLKQTLDRQTAFTDYLTAHRLNPQNYVPVNTLRNVILRLFKLSYNYFQDTNNMYPLEKSVMRKFLTTILVHSSSNYNLDEKLHIRLILQIEMLYVAQTTSLEDSEFQTVFRKLKDLRKEYRDFFIEDYSLLDLEKQAGQLLHQLFADKSTIEKCKRMLTMTREDFSKFTVLELEEYTWFNFSSFLLWDRQEEIRLMLSCLNVNIDKTDVLSEAQNKKKEREMIALINEKNLTNVMFFMDTGSISSSYHSWRKYLEQDIPVDYIRSWSERESQAIDLDKEVCYQMMKHFKGKLFSSFFSKRKMLSSEMWRIKVIDTLNAKPVALTSFSHGKTETKNFKFEVQTYCKDLNFLRDRYAPRFSAAKKADKPSRSSSAFLEATFTIKSVDEKQSDACVVRLSTDHPEKFWDLHDFSVSSNLNFAFIMMSFIASYLAEISVDESLKRSTVRIISENSMKELVMLGFGFLPQGQDRERFFLSGNEDFAEALHLFARRVGDLLHTSHGDEKALCCPLRTFVLLNMADLPTDLL